MNDSPGSFVSHAGSTKVLTSFLVGFLLLCLAARWAFGFLSLPYLPAISFISETGMFVFFLLLTIRCGTGWRWSVFTLLAIAQSAALVAALFYSLSQLYGYSSRYDFSSWFRLFRLHANILWAAAIAIVYFKLQSGRMPLCAALLLTTYLLLCIICDGVEQYLMPVTGAFPGLAAIHNAVCWWTQSLSPDASGMAEMEHYTLRIVLTCFFIGAYGLNKPTKSYSL